MARRIVGACFAVDFIKGIRSKDHGIGGLKLWYMYQRRFPGEEALGRDRFLEVYRRNGLKLRSKACKPRTTDSTHGLAPYANLVRDFISTGSNQLWVSDITYMKPAGLVTIKDLLKLLLMSTYYFYGQI